MPEKMRPKDKSKTSGGTECIFCYSSEENEEVLGKMLRKSGISIHYFCMLFSSDLWQRGKRDCDGILGFMPSDIRREQKRGVVLFCRYCKRKGASVRCSVQSCGKHFHFRCGIEAGGLCQFYEQFRAYCPEHRPRQKAPTLPKVDESRRSSTCCICMQDVSPKVANDTLCAPCCGGSWFHRICIQRYAVTAGAYFFKCPLCNNKEQFEAEMFKFGIYLPEQDAAWEREPNAYQELLERYSNCDAEKCLCPQGRGHVAEAGSQWELLLCTLCGSSGTHVKCKGLVDNGKESLCPGCAEITAKITKKRQKQWKNSCSKTVGPIVADSVEEITQHLQQQRICLLRAQRAARRQKEKNNMDEETLSTSQQQEQNQESDDWTESSEYEERTPVTSPSLLEDHRLLYSTPVVRIERASSETEVNIMDSGEDEETLESESDDSSQPGCARLISLQLLKLARQPGRQGSIGGSWDVRGVIEEEHKKVVLLSVMNKDSSSSCSKDTSVASATALLQQQLTLQAPTAEPSCEAPCSSENVDSVQSQKAHTRQRRRPQKQINYQDSSSGEEDIGKPKNRFVISPDRKAAFRRMIPGLSVKPLLNNLIGQPQVYEVSDSASDEDTVDRSLSQSTSKQPGTSHSVEESVSSEKEKAKRPPLPQKAAGNNTVVLEVIPLPEEDSAPVCQTSAETNPGPVIDNSGDTLGSAVKESVSAAKELVFASGTQEDNSELVIEKPGSKSGILRRGRGRPPKVKRLVREILLSQRLPAATDREVLLSQRLPAATDGEVLLSQRLPAATDGEVLLSQRLPAATDGEVLLSQRLPAATRKTRKSTVREIPQDLSSMRVARQHEQASEKGDFDYSRMSQGLPAASPRTRKEENSAFRAWLAQRQNRTVRMSEDDNRTGQNAGSSTFPDDVLAMQQSVSPAFAQFQIPKPQSTAQTSAASSVPLCPPTSTPTAALAASSVRPLSGNVIPPQYPGMTPYVRAQMRAYFASQVSPKPSSGTNSYRRASTAVQNMRHPAPGVQNMCDPSAAVGKGAPSSVAFNQKNMAPASAPVHSTQNVGTLSAPVTSAQSAGPLPASASSTAVTVTSPSTARNAEPYYITVPTTQPFHLGVIAMQPQGAVSVPQNTAAGVTTSAPCSMTMVAGQPRPSTSANTATQFIPILPQNTVPFLQWIPLTQCFPNSSTASGIQPGPQAQGQHHSSVPGQHDPSVPQETVSVFQPLPSEGQRGASCVPQGFLISRSVPGMQPRRLAGKQVPPAGHESLHASSQGHDADPVSLRNLLSSTAQAKSASYCGENHATDRRQSATRGTPGQSSTDPLHRAPSVQPCLPRLRPVVECEPSFPVTQPGAQSEGYVAQSSARGSDMAQNQGTGGGEQRTPVPVTLYAHSTVSPLMTHSQASSAVITGTVTRPVTMPQSQNNAPVTDTLQALQVTGLYCSPQARSESLSPRDQTAQQAGGLVAADRNAAPGRPTANVTSSRVARVPPNTSSILSARPTPSTSEQSVPSAPVEDDRSAMLNQQPRASVSPVVIAENNPPMRQSVAAAEANQSAVPQRGQPVRGGTDATAEPSVVTPSADGGDSSLAISRGKIWLGSDSLQSQFSKGDVVLLSDSDSDEGDLEITGTSLGKTVCGAPKSRHACHSGHQPACRDPPAAGSAGSSSPQIMGLLVPAPHKPPCPVHGLFRLVQHPKPTVPAKRNADGSISIDLTHEEPGPKRAHIEESLVLSDIDSDLEIIG